MDSMIDDNEKGRPLSVYGITLPVKEGVEKKEASIIHTTLFEDKNAMEEDRENSQLSSFLIPNVTIKSMEIFPANNDTTEVEQNDQDLIKSNINDDSAINCDNLSFPPPDKKVVMTVSEVSSSEVEGSDNLQTDASFSELTTTESPDNFSSLPNVYTHSEDNCETSSANPKSCSFKDDHLVTHSDTYVASSDSNFSNLKLLEAAEQIATVTILEAVTAVGNVQKVDEVNTVETVVEDQCDDFFPPPPPPESLLLGDSLVEESKKTSDANTNHATEIPNNKVDDPATSFTNEENLQNDEELVELKEEDVEKEATSEDTIETMSEIERDKLEVEQSAEKKEVSDIAEFPVLTSSGEDSNKEKNVSSLLPSDVTDAVETANETQNANITDEVKIAVADNQEIEIEKIVSINDESETNQNLKENLSKPSSKDTCEEEKTENVDRPGNEKYFSQLEQKTETKATTDTAQSSTNGSIEEANKQATSKTNQSLIEEQMPIKEQSSTEKLEESEVTKSETLRVSSNITQTQKESIASPEEAEEETTKSKKKTKTCCNIL